MVFAAAMSFPAKFDYFVARLLALVPIEACGTPTPVLCILLGSLARRTLGPLFERPVLLCHAVGKCIRARLKSASPAPITEGIAICLLLPTLVICMRSVFACALVGIDACSQKQGNQH